MTQLEKITIAADPFRFTLFREGIFYKCYNEDAMLFHQRVKPFTCSARIFKETGNPVISLGFPVTLLECKRITEEQLSDALDATNYCETSAELTFTLKENIKQAYKSFEEQVLISSSTPKDRHDTILDKIRSFDLANCTPMECMVFLHELKKELLLKT